MIAHDFLTALANLPADQHRVVAIAGKEIERVHRLATLHKISTAYEGFEPLAHDDSIGNKIHIYVSIVLYCFTVSLSLYYPTHLSASESLHCQSFTGH